MDTQKQIEDVAKAEDLRNLLDHIAWTDVIKPEIKKLRDVYLALLPSVVLGGANPTGLTCEQIAARVEGIVFIESLFEKILRKGRTAFKDISY